MAYSYLTAKWKPESPQVNSQRMRLNFDSNLRRWFGRNLGTWHSKRQYLFGDDEAIFLDMFIRVEKLTQEDPEYEKYRFSWWSEKDHEFFHIHQ